MMLIIVSGPSTVGKNPFIYKACELYGLEYVIPCTTRLIRNEETNGKDYFFLSVSEFQSKIQNNEICEWDYCLENYYGYMFDFPGNCCQITHGLSRMALRIKSKYPNEITTIFLMPRNKDKIFNNLKKIYSRNSLLLRETLVEEELCHSVLFDNIFTCSGSIFDLLNDEKMKQLLLSQKKDNFI